MSASGVKVDETVIDAFNAMKMNKEHAYIVMKIENKKKIVVKKNGRKLPANCTQSENMDIFKEMVDFVGKEPCYIVFDFRYNRSNQSTGDGLVFIFRCSDDSPVGEKMIYASSKDALKGKFDGLKLNEQCNDDEDFKYERFVKKLIDKDKV